MMTGEVVRKIIDVKEVVGMLGLIIIIKGGIQGRVSWKFFRVIVWIFKLDQYTLSYFENGPWLTY